MPAETVRKLFTAQGVNPELATISRIAAQVGLKLTLKRA
jgi:DNA-binding phage protein